MHRTFPARSFPLHVILRRGARLNCHKTVARRGKKLSTSWYKEGRYVGGIDEVKTKGRGTWALAEAPSRRASSRYEALFSSRSTSIGRASCELPTQAFSTKRRGAARMRASPSASCKCSSACYRYLHKEGMMYAARWVI